MNLIATLGAVAPCVYVGCRLSARVNYVVKFTLFAIFSWVFVTISIPTMLFKPFDYRNGLLPAWLFRCSMMLLGVTYEIRGKENIVKNTGCVVLINHQSVLDLTVMAHIWPLTPNGCTIVKKEVFWIWPFGLGSWLWGTVFIDKINPTDAKKGLNKAGAHIRTQKARIAMFPEGTRHRGDELLPFKKGAFHLAMEAKCPIQPVIINNYNFLDHKTHKFESGQNYITFLPAISTEGLNKENMPEFIDKVHKTMNDNYKKINQQLDW